MKIRYCRNCHYNEAIPMDNLCEKCFDMLWSISGRSKEMEDFGLYDDYDTHVASVTTAEGTI